LLQALHDCFEHDNAEYRKCDRSKETVTLPSSNHPLLDPKVLPLRFDSTHFDAMFAMGSRAVLLRFVTYEADQVAETQKAFVPSRCLCFQWASAPAASQDAAAVEAATHAATSGTAEALSMALLRPRLEFDQWRHALKAVLGNPSPQPRQKPSPDKCRQFAMGQGFKHRRKDSQT
jgi:hypothetical protein